MTTSVDSAAPADTTPPAATLERRGHIAVITLNRPRALNAVNSALSTAIADALEELDRDPELWVGVITGSGRAFCAGADLKEIAAGHPILAHGHEDWGFAGICQHRVDKPLIAAVNGFALGGGSEIVLACDLAVASEEAMLGLPEVRRGLMAAAGGVIRLQRQIPFKIAMEMVLAGEPVDAVTALRWGLVNRVVPADMVLDTAIELAEKISRNAPLAVWASKRMLYQTLAYADLDPGAWALNDAAIAGLVASDDAREGTTAFAEKRIPRWSGT